MRQIYRLLHQAWGPQHWWPGESPFEVMVGAILTQNCNWTNVEQAIRNLKDAGQLSLAGMLEAPVEVLAGWIRPTGYFNLKARRLRNFLGWLREREGPHGSWRETLDATGTPELREQLLAVNGLGPETVDSMLLYALGRPVFVVDAYTRRVLQRHFLLEGGEGYEQVRALFESHLPREEALFNEFHALFVHLGKDHCKPTARCEGCPLRGHPHDEHR